MCVRLSFDEDGNVVEENYDDIFETNSRLAKRPTKKERSDRRNSIEQLIKERQQSTKKKGEEE